MQNESRYDNFLYFPSLIIKKFAKRQNFYYMFHDMLVSSDVTVKNDLINHRALI